MTGVQTCALPILITLSKEVLYFNINGGEAVLDVVTDLVWNVEEEQIGGFTFKKVDDTHLKVKVAKNTTGTEIRKSIILSDTGKTTETKLTIVQTNVEKMLSISLSETEKNMITGKKGTQLNIPVSLNLQFDCKVSHSWIHVGELPEFSGDIVQDVNIPVELSYNGVAVVLIVFLNGDRKSTRLNSSHPLSPRMPSSA